jgi:hypothetical protein
VRAAEELAEQGEPLRHFDHAHDLHNHQARVDHMTELLGQLDGNGPDPITGKTERRAEVYDTSRHEDRVDRIMDAMAGHDTSDRTYDGR